MRGFVLFRNGAAIILILGLIFSLMTEKAQFLLWLTQFRNPVADYYFYYITKLGEPIGFVICGLWLGISSWKKLITIPVLGVIVMLTSYSLKEFFQFERPSLYLDRMCYEGPLSVLGYPMLSGFHSFPSGHSMSAWALVTLVAVLSKKTWMSVICLMLGVSVAVSRIYLLAHFLEDVVAGAMIGTALGFGVYFGYERWIKYKAKQNHSVLK